MELLYTHHIHLRDGVQTFNLNIYSNRNWRTWIKIGKDSKSRSVTILTFTFFVECGALVEFGYNIAEESAWPLWKSCLPEIKLWITLIKCNCWWLCQATTFYSILPCSALLLCVTILQWHTLQHCFPLPADMCLMMENQTGKGFCKKVIFFFKVKIALVFITVITALKDWIKR